jgi:trans-aconitate 2-methyltransferase
MRKIAFSLFICICSLLNLSLGYSLEEWEGVTYHKNSSIQYTWATTFLNKYPPQHYGSTLDIGCGSGKITAEMAEKHKECSFTGIDASPTMVETAKTNFPLTNLHFEEGDAETFHLGKKFDTIVSFSCLHWVKDKEKMFQSMHEALADNGKIHLFFAPKSDAQDRLDKAQAYVIKKDRWKEPMKALTSDYFLMYPEDFHSILVEAGFTTTVFEEAHTHSIFENRDKFKKWMSVWLPHLKVLPTEDHSAFVDDVIDRYLEKHPLDEDGRLHYYDYMLEVVAEKTSPQKTVHG